MQMLKSFFDVTPDNFYPKPKVYSSIIELTPKVSLDFDYEKIDKLLKICFFMKKKT